MARTNNLTNFLSDIAKAIKEKTGDQTAIPASDFDTKIKSIETKGNYQKKQLSFENNGNYSVSADTGYDAIEQLDISVDVTTNLQEKNITENGNYSPDEGYNGFSSVNVNVPTQEINNQNITITENGSYSADEGYTGLGTVIVNIKGSEDLQKQLDDQDRIIEELQEALKHKTKPPYTELEYIESTGTQYIDTGIKSDTIRYLEFKFMPTSLANKYQAYLSAYPDNFTAGAFESLTKTFLRYRTSEIYRVQTISHITPTTIAVYSDGIYFNGDQVSVRSTDTAISTTDDNLFIASTSQKTVPAAMRFYGLALTDLSGNLIANIIPVKYNGVVCVYDTVRKIYLTNSGTGEFIAGPEKGGAE